MGIRFSRELVVKQIGVLFNTASISVRVVANWFFVHLAAKIATLNGVLTVWTHLSQSLKLYCNCFFPTKNP